MLTQLDRLRGLRNVFVLTTSNLTEALDDAFLDRSDVMLYVGPPGVRAIYGILAGCLEELVRCGIITGVKASKSERERSDPYRPHVLL
jgi:SpoVK/Ycf46/Vps4 family AAA+-type ATPase